MEKHIFRCCAIRLSKAAFFLAAFLFASIYRADAQSISVWGTVTGPGGGY